MLLSVIVTVFISLKVDDLLLSLERRCWIMALKNLSYFTEFNAPLFLAQKELRYKVGRKKWDWFRNEKYKDVLNYIIDMGCDYYFEYLPLKRLGLPVPPASSKEQGLEV